MKRRTHAIVWFLIARPAIGFSQQIPRWELGPTISLIKVREYDAYRAFGFGGRATLNFSRLFAADVQFARDSQKEFFAPSNSRTEYRHDQFTANLKTTWRPQTRLRANPFALAGMGLARDGVSSTFQGPFPGSFKFYQNKFALRFGGGVQLVPLIDSLSVSMPQTSHPTFLKAMLAEHPRDGGIASIRAFPS